MTRIRAFSPPWRWLRRSCLAAALLLAALGAGAGAGVASAADPLAREFLFTAGANGGDRFGSAIAGLRDFDGDGAPDLAIGAYAYKAGTAFGRVYLLRAGKTPGTAPWMSFGGVAANELFGYALAGARDINGDGWSDLVVGSPRANGAASLSGRVNVYFGGPAADTVADLRLSGTESNQQFGISVAVPGDVNGDGWDDILVGAYNPTSFRGTVSLFLGGPAADSLPDLVIHSMQARDNLGYAIAGAGDLNHDGFADFVLGTPLYSIASPPRQEGRVWVYLGGANPDTIPDLYVTGRNANQHLGQWVSGGGDFNGDGFSDLLAGDGARDAHLFEGGAPLDSFPDATFTGGLTGAMAGDLNSDGFADIALALADRVWVMFGSATPDANLDATLTTSANPVVARVGDLDGTPGDDLAVGLPFEVTGNATRGAVRAWHVARYLLLAPNGRERWVAGLPDTVRWLGSDSVAVDVTLDGGASWTRLAAGSGGGFGRLAVTMPDTLTESARLRVTPPEGAANPALMDASDAAFALAVCEAFPLAGRPDWFVADRETLSWRAARPVDVYLAARGGTTAVRLAAGVPGAGVSDLAFDVPLVHADSVVARIVSAGSAGAGALEDESENAMRVIPYQLLRPNGREIWIGGAEDSVTWIGATRANLQLSLDAGFTWTTLATNAGGSHLNRQTVTVPRGVSSQALLRVVAAGQSPTQGHMDQSDRTFFVTGPPGGANLPLRLALHAAWGDSAETFGQSVGSAGDLNGDGYTDLLVGTPLDDTPTLEDAGSAEVFFGGPNADDVPDVVIRGTKRGAQLGFAVAGLGDFDGDGFGDFAVSAPGYSGTGSGGGIVYLFRGGPALDNVADAAFPSRLAQLDLGSSIAALGDINGDGFADFAASATYHGNTFYLPIYFGSATLDSIADVQILSPLPNDASFGGLVAPAGDFNADGWPDLMVRRRPSSGLTTVYFYWGGPGMDGEADRLVQGERGYEFAWSMAPAGDFNADGVDDVAIGTPYAPGPLGAPGDVRIYLGGANATFNQIELLGEDSGELFGVSVAGRGDINGDGFADLVVGAAANGTAGTLAGRAYVFYGYVTPDTLPKLVINGPRLRTAFGISVAVLPHFTDSDLAGFAIGAPRGDAHAFDGGEAFVYEIDHPVLLAPRGGETWIAGETAEIRWSSALLVTIELSNDGGASWIPLAAHAGGAAVNRFELVTPDALTARARVRLSQEGQPLLKATSDESDTDFRIASRPPAAPMALRSRPASGAAPRAGERAGALLAAAGDVNGDGRADLLAARREAGGGASHWVVDLVSGTGGVLARYRPARATDAVAIAGAGDMNGDGFADVAIGVPGDDTRGENAGRVDVYWGGAAPDTTADATFHGARAGDRFGAAVAAAGDVDANGSGDLLVGAPRAARIPAAPGAAYLFLGGAAPDPLPDAALEGPAAGDAFGAAVAELGDVNGDGCLDFAIGAPGPDALEKTTGHVYLFCGGAADALAPELTLDGEAEGDRFGQTLAAAGDANGDGMPDLLVGAPFHDGAAPDAGRAYLYLGGRLDEVADVVMSGAARGEAFGAALAGGVDVNADGFADWLVGAPYAGGDEQGGAWFFQGNVIPDSIADRAWSGGAAGDRLGSALATVSRPAGDGYASLMFGAPFAEATSGGALLADAGAILAYESNRWWIASPAAGEMWPVGSEREIRWQGAARADVALVRESGAEEIVASAAGGDEDNTLRVTVRGPGGVARVRLRSSAAGVVGEALSEPFSLSSALALHSLTLTRVPGEGVRLEWATTPNLLDGGVTAYRLYRRAPGLALSERVADSIRATSYVYPERVRGATYILSGLTAAGAEVVLGETTLAAGPRGLQVWPMPLASGVSATIEFAPPVDARGWSAADLDVSVFDIAGRRVATLARGALVTDVGVLRLGWNGTGGDGRRVGSGIFFLRARAPSAGFRLERRLVVTR